MKKTLLLFALAIVATGVFAQKVWNFSVDPFGANGMAGASAPINFTANFTYDGLTAGTDGTAMFTLTANAKTIDGTAYTHRLQTGGGGGAVAPSKIPVTRYLSFYVSGASTIKIGAISSNSAQSRTLIIVNEDQSVIDSIVNVIGSAAATYTYEYKGGASKIYIYSRASGVNYYYLSATNVVSSVNNVFADKGIFFNGKVVENSKQLSMEIFDVVGKKLGTTNQNFNMQNLPNGIYMVKAEGVDGAMKFTK
jgi:hypothetical protein